MREKAVNSVHNEEYQALDAAAKKYDALWREHYDAGVERDCSVGGSTVKQTMLEILTRVPDAPLIETKQAVVSRKEADDRACRLGNALVGLGLSKGERVSLVMSNCPEIVYGFMACYKTGCIAAAFNQRCTSVEICASINTVGSAAVLIEAENLPKIAEAVRSGACPSLRDVVVVRDEGDCPDEGPALLGSVRVHDYARLVERASAEEPAVDVLPEDGAILLFTGGTTGVSKGVCATHWQITTELKLMHHWCAPALKTPDPSVLIVMPMTHIMGINYGVHWQLINGGCCVISEGVRCDQIVRAFDRFHPTMWAALPTLLHSLGLNEQFMHCAYKDVEFVIFGGSFIASETLKLLSSGTNACFAESYGMSESFGFVSANPVRSGGKLGSIGLPLCNTDVLVVDLETGLVPLEPGLRGEIVFRGRQVASQYWENPDETAKTIRNGWIYSGDIGYMDEDGFFYVVDRKKDTIVVSGFNVFPKDIDERLMSHPDIVDACTIGVPCEHSGERPKSYVVLKEGSSLSEREVIAWCKEELVAYKAPKFVEFVSEIPKTRNRKQDRALLRKMDAQERMGLSAKAS